MVMFATQPPRWIASARLTSPPGFIPVARFAFGANGKIWNTVVSCQLSVASEATGNQDRLALAELEPLACALLSVLLAFLAARVAGHVALGLQLGAQFGIELEQRAGDAQLDRSRLSVDAAPAHAGDDVEAGRGFARHQR